MNTEILLDPTFSTRLCLTLLHSLWQMTLLAVIVWGLDRVWRGRSVERSYALHVAALIAGLAALPVTYALVDVTGPQAVVQGERGDPQMPAAAAHDALPVPPIPGPAMASEPTGGDLSTSVMAVPASLPSAAESVATDASVSWQTAAGWIVALYALGVLVMFVRLGRGFWCAHRLAVNARPLCSGPAAELLQSLARQWSLRAVPVLAVAEQIVVPKVVGLLRPTILLPASAVTGLSADELQMILAHELAHIRRHDLWVNLLQRLAETVLFFNPALWFLSRRVSTLREFCCDELTCRAMVAAAAGDPLPSGDSRPPLAAEPRTRYAAALLRVAELSRPAPVDAARARASQHSELAALAATGRPPSDLRRRIAHLFGEPLQEPLRLSRGGLIVLFGGIALLTAGPLLWPSTSDSASAQTNGRENSNPTSPVQKGEASNELNPIATLISGTCTTDEGQPVSDAEVRLYHREMVWDEATLLQTVRTNENGRYEFRKVPYPSVQQRHSGTQPYALAVKAEGHGSTLQFVPMGFEEIVTIDFSLKKAATLKGIVTGSNSEPIEGADVWVQGIDLGPLQDLLSTKTDAAGRFQIPDVDLWNAGEVELFSELLNPDGEYRIVQSSRIFRVRHTDYGTRIGEFTSAPSTVDLTLKPAAIVEGRVVFADSGEPAAGVLVRALNQSEHPEGSDFVRTDDDGKYRFLLPESHYNFWAHHDKLTAAANEGFVARSGQTNKAPDLLLIKGGLIEGRLIDAETGQPMRLRDDDVAFLTINGPTRPASSSASQVEPIHSDGTFQFRLPPGVNRLRLPHSSYGSFEVRPEAATGGKDPLKLNVIDGETIKLDLKVVRVARDEKVGTGKRSHGQTVESVSTVDDPSENSQPQSTAAAVEGIDAFSFGSKVEVVAIGTHDQVPLRWWDAEGHPIQSLPFVWSSAGTVTADGVSRRIVYRIDALPKDAEVTWKIVGCHGSAGGKVTFQDEQPSARYFTRYFIVPEDRKNVQLRLGVATGPWKMVAEMQMGGTQGLGLGDRKSLVYSGAFDTTQGTVAIVSHNYFDHNFRIVAVDKQGVIYEPTGRGGVSAGEIYQTRSTFPNLTTNEIDHFEFQVRDYEWVEIDDLPLQPREGE